MPVDLHSDGDGLARDERGRREGESAASGLGDLDVPRGVLVEGSGGLGFEVDAGDDGHGVDVIGHVRQICGDRVAAGADSVVVRVVVEDQVVVAAYFAVAGEEYGRDIDWHAGGDEAHRYRFGSQRGVGPLGQHVLGVVQQAWGGLGRPCGRFTCGRAGVGQSGEGVLEERPALSFLSGPWPGQA